jgi:hypothetical protein
MMDKRLKTFWETIIETMEKTWTEIEQDNKQEAKDKVMMNIQLFTIIYEILSEK